jgi:hypothetical protein
VEHDPLPYPELDAQDQGVEMKKSLRGLSSLRSSILYHAANFRALIRCGTLWGQKTMGLSFRLVSVAAAFACTSCASAAQAQDFASSPWAGAEIFFATDTDNTTIVIAAIDADVRNDDDGRRLGLRLENAWIQPLGDDVQQLQRVFVQAADRIGNWKWAARVGTDGDNVIGSISASDNSRFRKEIFAERDIIQTPLGLERGIYNLFVGAAIDLPADDRNIFTVVGGVEEFTGLNTRFHARLNYIHVVKPEWGLSVQMRGRYFHSTEPGEFDYFSPEHFVQVLPVIQMRRSFGDWRLLAAGGIGVQQFTGSDLLQANFAELRAERRVRGSWFIGAEALLTNAPGNLASQIDNYSYFQTKLTVRSRF